MKMQGVHWRTKVSILLIIGCLYSVASTPVRDLNADKQITKRGPSGSDLRCSIDFGCPLYKSSVCGSDGNWHRNPCMTTCLGVLIVSPAHCDKRSADSNVEENERSADSNVEENERSADSNVEENERSADSNVEENERSADSNVEGSERSADSSDPTKTRGGHHPRGNMNTDTEDTKRGFRDEWRGGNLGKKSTDVEKRAYGHVRRPTNGKRGSLDDFGIFNSVPVKRAYGHGRRPTNGKRGSQFDDFDIFNSVPVKRAYGHGRRPNNGKRGSLDDFGIFNSVPVKRAYGHGRRPNNGKRGSLDDFGIFNSVPVKRTPTDMET